ncbi:CAP domain-containing protein [Pseudoruegeria sp. SK021]|uniref:CAP domain-containing protein n=1 Tax=Pseudoruegeria sp. SK021 TaxID=1933035 RepID=UPI00111C44B3|nr:CAP domain-containing protein [Pseudoruegeria sp. SK021]
MGLALILGLALAGCGASVSPKAGGNSCSAPLIGKAQPITGELAVDFRKSAPSDGLDAEERAVYDRIMAERAARGLPRIPLSKSLSLVAARHATDMSRNFLGGPQQFRPGTSYHSWSDAPYPTNHDFPEAMWQAPRRLGTAYCGNGYEILAWGYATGDAAVDSWMTSASHAPVILNRGIWARFDWKAVGVGIVPKTDAGPAVYMVWFGAEPDPAGPPVAHR